MNRLLTVLLLSSIACQGTDPLGGQEGEPLVPPGAPPPAMEPDVDAGMDCAVGHSCAGPGWCADYGNGSEPDDFDAACEAAGGTPSDQPCDIEGNAGFCRDATLDPCTVVWVYDDLSVASEDFCDDNGLELVSPRG
ncbi:MAG: hypothetical protein R3F61_38115 [Myxococcota bacterium]